MSENESRRNRYGSSGTVKRPTPEMRELAVLIHRCIARLLSAGRFPGEWQVFTSHLEAINLTVLIARYVEAILELSRRDMVLVVPASTLARSCIEIAAKTLWMLRPIDPFGREVRWLAHLRSEEDYLEREARWEEKLGGDGEAIRTEASRIRGVRQGIEAKLPSPHRPIQSVPKVPDLLRSVGLERWYPAYVELSQFVHGTHRATDHYRDGAFHVFREDVDKVGWGLPLRTAFSALSAVGRRVLDCTNHSGYEFCDQKMTQRILLLCERVDGPER